MNFFSSLILERLEWKKWLDENTIKKTVEFDKEQYPGLEPIDYQVWKGDESITLFPSFEIQNKSGMYKCFVKYNINQFEKVGNGCLTIGKGKDDGKWYGWTHRGIYGFKVGDVCKQKSLGNYKGYEFKIKDENEAKECARHYCKELS